MPLASRSDLPMFVLDVLRYDIEQVENILDLLNSTGSVGWRVFWPHDFTRDEVVEALRVILDRGDVRALDVDPDSDTMTIDFDHRGLFPESADRLWYRLTQQGRRRWEEWEDYPVDPNEELR